VSGPLSAPATTVDSLIAQARVQRARGAWQTALQELPPVRKFPPPEKPRHDDQQNQAKKRPAPKQAATTPAYLQPLFDQPGILGQRLDRFV